MAVYLRVTQAVHACVYVRTRISLCFSIWVRCGAVCCGVVWDCMVACVLSESILMLDAVRICLASCVCHQVLIDHVL